MTNFVYLGTSIDGYIAGPDRDLGWLEYVPVPDGDDRGFADFMAGIDAIVMGRGTFETLLGFGVGWHFGVPGIILSTTMNSAPPEFDKHVNFAKGPPADIVAFAKERGYERLYIDGGVTVQRFLREDLVDEMIISEIPVVLGGGVRLFDNIDRRLDFEVIGSEVLAGQIVKTRFRRRRS